MLGLRDLQAAELGLPPLDAGVADAVTTAQVGDGNASIVFLQYTHDLIFRETAAFHVLVLVVGQKELQTGLAPRGNVIRNTGFQFSPFWPRSLPHVTSLQLLAIIKSSG